MTMANVSQLFWASAQSEYPPQSMYICMDSQLFQKKSKNKFQLSFFQKITFVFLQLSSHPGHPVELARPLRCCPELRVGQFNTIH